MKKLFVALAACGILSGCASFWTSTDYTPHVGDDIVYIGKGGAMEEMAGVEVWKSGLPNKPYKIVGLVTGKIKNGWGAEGMLLEACAIEAKEKGADAIISRQLQQTAGTPYYNNTETNIYQSNTANVYGNQGNVAIAQGNFARPYTSPAGSFASGFNRGMAMAMAMGSLSGSFVAIKYVAEE